MVSLSRISTVLRNYSIRAKTELNLQVLDRKQRTTAPRVLFCPSESPQGASLLRAYNVSEELRNFGWTSACLSHVIKAKQRERLIKIFDPDVLVFQQCRHAENDIDRSYGYPVVLDTDDADFHLNNIPGLKERLDRTSRGAAGVMVGSQYLQGWHAKRCSNTEIIWTGSPSMSGPRKPHTHRDKILAWAQAAPLSYEKELDFVIALDAQLRLSGSDHRLRFYGIATPQQEAELRGMFKTASHVETVPPLTYDDYLTSLQDVAVGLSPVMSQTEFSRGKSFGKVLGYLDAKVPAIVSDEADHAQFFEPETGVVTNDISVWRQSALDLLASPERRTAMSDAAYDAFQQQLSLRAAATKVDRFLRQTLNLDSENKP